MLVCLSRMSTNDYQHAAARYTLRGISGNDALAFRWLKERLPCASANMRALDLGCGSGRSTRFLQALGFETSGIDVSAAMVAQARQHNPTGDYYTYTAETPLPFPDATFDIILSTWVVLELAPFHQLAVFMRNAARVLKPSGTAFIVTNTPAFYAHRWLSCAIDFPENTIPLRSGQKVKARLMPEDVVVTDVFWHDDDYRNAFAEAGLTVQTAAFPQAPAEEAAHWADEIHAAPYVIYEVQRL